MISHHFGDKIILVISVSLHKSRVAQWKRAGPITQRSVDRNHALLNIFSSVFNLFTFFFLSLQIFLYPYFYLASDDMMYEMVIHSLSYILMIFPPMTCVSVAQSASASDC